MKIKIEQKLSVFDIEAKSKTKNKDLVMAGFYDGIEYKYFLKINDLIDYFLKNCDNYIVYSHFGGKYDMLFIFEAKDYIFSKGFTIEDIIIVAGAVMAFSIKKYKNKKCIYKLKFADSYRVLKGSLKNLTADFNVSHLKKEFDFESGKEFKITPENIDYNKYDCIGLYEILDIFFNKYAKGIGYTISIGSASMKVYKNNFEKEPLNVLNNYTENFVRETYYGGRCEVFKKHLDKGYYYDVNSLYPYVMSLDIPYGYYFEVLKYEPELIGFYKADVYIPENLNIPPIPYRYKNKLIFPTGYLNDVYLTSAEIDLLKAMGGSFDIKQGICFEDKKPVFKEFIDYYYNLKLEAEINKNSSDRLIAKFFLNNLYGKFGQGRENEKYFFLDNTNINILDKKIKLYDFDLNIYFKTEKSKSKDIKPYISSWITSGGRVELYKWFIKALFDIYYCDTDGFLTKTKLETSNRLGDIKLEGIATDFIFNAPKDYKGFLDGKPIEKRKGFFKGQIENEVIIKTASFKEAIKNNKNIISEKYNFLKDKKIIKKLKENNHKRIFYKNESKPFNFLKED